MIHPLQHWFDEYSKEEKSISNLLEMCRNLNVTTHCNFQSLRHQYSPIFRRSQNSIPDCNFKQKILEKYR